MTFKMWWLLLILVFGQNSGSVKPELDRRCAGLPDDLDFSKRTVSLAPTRPTTKALDNSALDPSELNSGDFWTYHPLNASLTLDLSSILYLDDASCTHAGQVVSHFNIDLVRLNPRGRKPSSSGRRCRILPKKSFIQTSIVVNSTHPVHTFTYVQGLYFIRVSMCDYKSLGSSMCIANLRQVICSNVKDFKASRPKNKDMCMFQAPNNLTVNITSQKSSSSAWMNFISDEDQRSRCKVNIKAAVPLCTAHQDYDRITVAVVQMGLDEPCDFDEYIDNIMIRKSLQDQPGGIARLTDNGTKVETVRLRPCPGNECEENEASLEYAIDNLWKNSSYCLFFRPDNPHCQGDYGCLFYTRPLRCDELYQPVRRGLRPFKGLTDIVTEPVFIGVVSLTLFLSLSLLMWTVIQCSKSKPGTPLITSGSNGSNGVSGAALKKAPPRSLTEDDLEHISRLPSQEIVLVYFPDSKRFKDLNRKLRDWLITLDVNDVKDIYDEKCSEDVLKNPEQWVKDTLGGPEKRIILVCSRLAYECLNSVKRQSYSYFKTPLSPRFVETDPHFGLLTRAIAYIEREMRGNYRNLICVRYEDIKICAREYSSEAFNIVPGTEYVLPQHLEDIYRWIHPRNPRPECWAESKPEVRELLDVMRHYRHHDENIFTVQFSSTNMIADITPEDELTTVTSKPKPST